MFSIRINSFVTSKYQATHIGAEFSGSPLKSLSLLVTTLCLASPGFATWRIGGFAVFCHFGNFLAIFWPILILGQFVIAPYSNIF